MSDEGYEKSLIEDLLPLLQKGGEDQSAVDSQTADAARRLRTFLDEIPGGFFIYRADGDEEIIYANHALLTIFGCKTHDEFKKLTGKSFRGIVHPDDYERVERDIINQISQSDENIDTVEYRIIRKDGYVRWLEDFGHFIHGENGDYYYVFVTDATEKVSRRVVEKATLINESNAREKRLQDIIEEYAEESREIKQEHLRRLEVIEALSSNYDAMLYADFENDVVIPYRLSVRIEKQFDKKLEVRKLSWFWEDYIKVWVHPDDRSIVAKYTDPANIRRLFAKEHSFYINYRCINNGRIEYIQLRLVNIGDEKSLQFVIGFRNVEKEIQREMEEKKLFQAALEKARQGAAAKNAFLSNMSHDMRTPLNAIFGYIELARKNENDPAAVDGYFTQIKEAGEQILELVDKVLEISYVESQDFSLDIVECSINEIMRDVYDAESIKAEQKNISLSLDTDGVVHDAVYADAEKLRRIVSHIAGNAVKYTRRGGKVKMTVTEQKSTSPEFTSFVITVADNGIGISKEALRRIFDPFERANNTTASGVYGSGLGLTIAKQLAESMDGTIDVKSTLGKGSVFTFTVSVRYIKNEAHASCDVIDLKGKRILIVEDNEINLEIETDILEDLGFKIDSAVNGKIAVDKLRENPDGYDIVLMDIQMPVMDGRRAAQEIRALPDKRAANIPIIALSANALDSDKRESLKAGMNAHLTKPFDVDELIKAFTVALIHRG